MGLHVLADCEACTERYNYRPPCLGELKRYKLSIRAADSIGLGGNPQCPMIVGMKDIMDLVKSSQPAESLNATDNARDAIKAMRKIRQQNPSATQTQLGLFQYRESQQNFCVVYSGAGSSNTRMVFLKPMADMNNNENYFWENGLTVPKNQRTKQQVQKNAAADQRRPTFVPPRLAPGTFVRYTEFPRYDKPAAPQEIVDWTAIAKAYDNSGTLGETWARAGMNQLSGITTGCGNLEKAWGKAINEVAPAKIKQVAPQWASFGIAIIGGLVIQVGAIGLAVALGAVLGGFIGSIVAPGPGSVEGAALGVQVAMWIVNIVCGAMFLKDMNELLKKDGGAISQGSSQAFNGSVDQGANMIGGALADLIVQAISVVITTIIAHGAGKFRGKMRDRRLEEMAIKTAEEDLAVKRRAQEAPSRNPQSMGPTVDFEVPIREYLRKAKDAEARGDSLAAFENYMEAERSYLQWRVMKGHAKGVETIVECISEHLLPALRKAGTVENIKTLFAGEPYKITLSNEEAAVLLDLSTKVERISVKNHDFVGAGNKGLARTNEGMKFPKAAVPPDIVAPLKDALAKLGKEPTAVTDKKVGDVLDAKFPADHKMAGQFKYPELRKFWQQRNYEAIDRAFAARDGIDFHNTQQPHHMHELIKKHPDVAIESGADIYKSKIEVERTYGTPIKIEDNALGFREGDKADLTAPVKLAQAATRLLKNKGFDVQKLTIASKFCDKKQHELWTLAP